MERSAVEILFDPSSIAIIGASTQSGSVGNDIAKNITEGKYQGEIFLVNPKVDTLFGRQCYSSVSELPSAPDLSIIIVPAAIVPTVLREAAEKGTRAAIIVSAGFKESGKEGALLEDELRSIAKEYGIALLGPNCLGFLRPDIGLNASFAPALPANGRIAFFSQSGALCTSILDLAAGKVGFSKFVSTGNKASIGEQEILSYLATDSATDVISFYSENISDAASFISLGRSVIARADAKPIIGIKSGRTESGMKASSSHTGALAGSDASYDALFRQARVLRTDTLRELLDSISVFSENPIPEGNRVAIVTNAGGPGVLAADALAKSHCVLAKIFPETEMTLRSALPKAAGVGNPIDVLGDAKADRYRFVLETISAESGVDSILVIVTPQSMTESEATAEAILETKKRTGKPVIAVLSGENSFSQAAELLRKSGVSVFQYPEEAAKAIGSLSEVASWRSRDFSPKREFTEIKKEQAKEIVTRAYSEERTLLYEREAYKILDAYGFPLLKSGYATTPEEATEIAKEIDRPVALKIVSPDIIHKTETGGVMLGIDPENAAEGFEELMRRVRMKAPEAKLEGAMVVEMARPGGKELILGLKKEPGLGTVIVAGMGGIYTEVIRDAAFRFVPIVREDGAEMLEELRSTAILSGVRGEDAINREFLIELLERLSRLAEDIPEIRELDINPLIVFPDRENFRVVDARIAIEN